jgi:large subunit ribosomal protein L7/L12
MALDKSVFAESLRTMPILELKALVDAMEKVFGSVGSRVPAKTAVVEKIAEKTSFDVTFVSIPMDKKIAAIKVIREVLNLGLKDAKDFVDTLPKPIVEGVSRDEAERIRVKLADISAVVNVI